MAKAFRFIGGVEDFLVTRKGKTAWEEMTREIEDDFGKEVVDGDALKVDDVPLKATQFQQAVETMPMFGGRKAVWFRNVNFLADTIMGKSETTQKALERLQDVLQRIDPTQVDVLITASPVDRRRSFYNFIKKEADWVWIEDPSAKGGEVALADFIGECAATEGVRIGHAAAEMLVGQLNGSIRVIREEINKLATYLVDGEEKEITPALIMEMVPVFGDGDFFEGTEAFFSGDLEWTLKAVERHFFAGNSIRPLLGSWQSRNRLLIQLRVLLDAGAIRLGGRGLAKGALDQAKATFGEVFGPNTEKSSYQVFGQHPFYLGKLAETAQRYPLKKLLAWQTEFFNAFEETLQKNAIEAKITQSLVLRCLG